jgi:acetoin utilization deacetylase AcuC-like enzyme
LGSLLRLYYTVYALLQDEVEDFVSDTPYFDQTLAPDHRRRSEAHLASMVLVASPLFARHLTPPGHPERVERAQVLDSVANRWALRGGRSISPRPATDDELLRVHTAAHVERLAGTAGESLMLDPDTFTSPDSYDIALLAAGATVQAAEHAVTTRDPAFALVRPPGHHAEADRAMGFCFFNNVAVAAAAMLAAGLERIAVVDIDVHHGNGTQATFYDNPRVLYVSTHQFPFYPGTGAADEVGMGDGRGFTVNVPMESGSTDTDYALVHRELIRPILHEFRPQLVLVSAGFDAHECDPLASMRMTTEGYAAVVASLRDAAARHGALALVTEGGYDLNALGASLDASLAVLENGASPPQALVTAAAPRGARAAAQAHAAQKPFWPAL